MEGEGRITFRKLAVRRRIHDVIVGYEKTGSYLVLDHEAYKILQHLQKHSIQETKKAYPWKNISSFVETLRNKDFIYKIGNHVVGKHKHIVDILHIPKRDLTWMRHPVSIFLYAAVLLFGVFAAWKQSLFPHPAWFFFTGKYVFLVVTTCFVYWILLFLHELGHYLALRSTGHRAGFSIIHRWHLLLPYANISNARILPRKQRIFVYLAGIGMDLFVFCIGAIAIHFGILPGFLRFVLLLVFFNIVTQFMLVKKTDITTVLEHSLGIDDLLETFKKLLDASCLFCKKKTKLTKKDRNIGADLFPLYVISLFFAIVLLLGYIVPIIWEIIHQGIKDLFASGPIQDQDLFTDSFLALLLLAIFFSFYFVSMLREAQPYQRMQKWFAIFGFTIINYLTIFLIALPIVFFTHTPFTLGIFFLLGLLYGNLFSYLLEHASLAKETPLTVIAVVAVVTSLLFLGMLEFTGFHVPLLYPSTIYSTALGVGILLSYFSPRIFQ